MVRPEEEDSFDDVLSFRCWKTMKKELDILADRQNLDLADYVRGVLARHIRDEIRCGK